MAHHWNTMDGRKAVSFRVLFWLITVCYGHGCYQGTDAQLMRMGWTRHRGAWRREPHQPGRFRADSYRPVQVSEARPQPDKLPRLEIAVGRAGRTIIIGPKP